MRINLVEKIVWSFIVFLHIVFILTIDFIPNSTKTGLDAFNLGYFMDDFNEFKIQGIPNILIIDCWKFEIYHVGVVDCFFQKNQIFAQNLQIIDCRYNIHMMKGFIALVSTSYNCSNKIITSLNTYLLNEFKSFTFFTIYN
jgi:hypothetical protein